MLLFAIAVAFLFPLIYTAVDLIGHPHSSPLEILFFFCGAPVVFAIAVVFLFAAWAVRH